jgi:hypothetical protein
MMTQINVIPLMAAIRTLGENRGMLVQLRRQMRSERNGNRDGTRTHGDGQRERIERVFKDLVVRGCRGFRSSGVLVEQRPSGRGDHQASADLYCIDRDAEECEYMHSPQQGAEQQKETVDRDFLRQ